MWMIKSTFLIHLRFLEVFSSETTVENPMADCIKQIKDDEIISDKAIHRRDDSVIFILCRNSDKDAMKATLLNFEQQFNQHHNYPYIFLNDKDWEEGFKTEISNVVSGTVEFGKVPKEDWDMPEQIDVEKAKKNWTAMKKQGVLYADIESYHNMCRFYSRKFFLHPLTLKYKYYWRVEPGVKFHCPIDEDPFEVMENNGYEYGFTIILKEQMESIPSLWEATKRFLNIHKLESLNEDDGSHLRFTFDENGSYNGYHFYNNFEIAAFEFFRSDQYREYVEYLEKVGGFYYERWGDAPVHTLAVVLFMNKKKVYFFEKIGYTHDYYTHCPRNTKNCDCRLEDDFGNEPGSGIWPYLKEQLVN